MRQAVAKSVLREQRQRAMALLRQQELARCEEATTGRPQVIHAVIAGASDLEHLRFADPDQKMEGGQRNRRKQLKTQLLTLTFAPTSTGRGAGRSKTSLHVKKHSTALNTIAGSAVAEGGSRLRDEGQQRQGRGPSQGRSRRTKSFLQLSHRSTSPRGAQTAGTAHLKKQVGPLAEVDVQKKPIHQYDRDVALPDATTRRIEYGRHHRWRLGSLGKKPRLSHIMSQLTDEEIDKLQKMVEPGPGEEVVAPDAPVASWDAALAPELFAKDASTPGPAEGMLSAIRGSAAGEGATGADRPRQAPQEPAVASQTIRVDVRDVVQRERPG